MQAKHLCVLIYIRTKGEAVTVKLQFKPSSKNIFVDRSKAVFLCGYVSCLSCFLVCSLQPCGHLLGKGWPLGSLVCNV